MNEEEQRALIMDFERNRQMLGNISQQKQQYAMQSELINASLEELGKTKEKTVLKVVGNILITKDVKEMENELKERKESVDLRLKTLEKQEESALKKLNSIRAKIEGPKDSKESKAETEAEEKPKSDKKSKK